MNYDIDDTCRLSRAWKSLGLDNDVLAHYVDGDGLSVTVDAALIERLAAEVVALEKMAVTQTAMIVMMAGLLATKGSLTKAEAALIAMAGTDAADHEGLAPADVGRWFLEHVRSLGG